MGTFLRHSVEYLVILDKLSLIIVVTSCKYASGFFVVKTLSVCLVE